jgi:hypothetical protein
LSEPGRDPSLRLAGLLLSERRTATRYSLPEDGSEPPVLDEQGSTLTVQILNISAGGISLLVNQRVQQGEMLKLELPSKDQWGVQKLLARVLQVERQGPDIWQASCTFTRRLKDLELVALL